MVTTPKRVRLCLALIVANMLFIWGNSALTAEVSSAISDFVWRVLGGLFSGQNTSETGGTGLLRKLAHFAEFACLGLLWCWYLLMGKRKAWLGFLPGLCTACVDEAIQSFVPGRAPRVTDIAIDLAGFGLGLGTMVLIQSIKQWRNNQ